MNTMIDGVPVYFVDGSRTPFLKARGKPNAFSASDLATHAGRAILARHAPDPEQIDEVILGCAMPGIDEANIGRIVALRVGCGHKTPGWTVMRNCASAMQALDSAAKDIVTGRAQLVLAGGTEAMSRAPILYNDDMVDWLGDLNAARSTTAKLKTVAGLRPGNFKPVISLMHGLTDPIVQLNMGQTCEIIAHRFGITREEMDEYAARSHQRLAAAYDANHMDEIEPLYTTGGDVLDEDDGMRRDSRSENQCAR